MQVSVEVVKVQDPLAVFPEAVKVQETLPAGFPDGQVCEIVPLHAFSAGSTQVQPLGQLLLPASAAPMVAVVVERAGQLALEPACFT